VTGGPDGGGRLGRSGCTGFEGGVSVPQDETGRKPDLSDLDSFAGVDELGVTAHDDTDDRDPELDARDEAFEAGGGARGGIGGVGQLGDNLATGPVPDFVTDESTELHEL